MARIDPDNRQPGQIAYLGMDGSWYDNPSEGSDLSHFAPGWAPKEVVDAAFATDAEKQAYYAQRQPLVNTGRWTVNEDGVSWVSAQHPTGFVTGASTGGASSTSATLPLAQAASPVKLSVIRAYAKSLPWDKDEGDCMRKLWAAMQEFGWSADQVAQELGVPRVDMYAIIVKYRHLFN